MKLLVVEDDAKISEFISKGLNEAGFKVDLALDGDIALQCLEEQKYGMVVLDLMLPKRDGLSVLKELRRRNVKTPVIILSAKKGLDDRILGLKEGADDYLVKPFSMQELLVRIETVLRRSQPPSGEMILKFLDLSLDLVSRTVTRGGRTIELQAREFVLLELLMRNPEKVLTKAIILEKIWDYRFDPQTNVVDVLVCRLRAKVDKGFKVRFIHTLRGLGYVLKHE